MIEISNSAPRQLANAAATGMAFAVVGRFGVDQAFVWSTHALPGLAEFERERAQRVTFCHFGERVEVTFAVEYLQQ